ncbi:DUF3263 domain-containing protein [Streptosporangium sp. NBC_01755]|uniref:DUF3263 domain-containing protein n=1 Tax=unclassified Streptosporangium TaxID=2632669 RepID=UPI002DD91DFB|nr:MULTISPECIES: DUF3263 domain-containing protein [unclassified Streptosporangium]WSA25758.1 DUF3263 domain-containing protein [Streptosporangium sp. NBC_01810]WSD02852.1 DUF3263 domain-containing protein [Streptosporangium sp. NBC_01755]
MDTEPISGDSAGGGAAREPASPALTDRERELLAFERRWWRHAGAKEQAVREAFDISATRYYQLLSELIDLPAALAHDPMLVKRLRRLRETRRSDRATRKMGLRP